MPYVIQYTRHLHEKVEELEKRTAPKEETQEAQAAANAMMYADGAMGMQGGPALLMAPPGAPGGYVDPMYAQQMGGMPPMPPQGMPQQQQYPPQGMGMPPQGMPGMY